ncbi:MAG: LLM class flavin-dependent oxidoreductase, partial [Candidatus Binatia bacterium]
MNVGAAIVFQNPLDARTDYDVYKDDLSLGDLVEPLGFDSIWGVEHHFTDYTMCPDVLQLLTWFARRTKSIQVGSMVVVLPWHDPIRVAEQVSVLDHMSDGRVVLGIGRGLGRVEFEGFRVPMGESRDRFIESAKIITRSLDDGVLEGDGPFYRIPRTLLR